MNAEFNIFEIFLNSATGNKYTISISLCKQVFINLLIIFLEWGNEIILMLQSLIHVIEIKSIPGKVFLTFGMVHFVHINQSPHSRHSPPPLPPLLNVGEYWKSSKTEACAKNLSQTLPNNIDNGTSVIALRIYVRYKKKNEK